MSGRIITRPWTRQPQGAAGPNRSDSRATALVASISGPGVVFGSGNVSNHGGVILTPTERGNLFGGFEESSGARIESTLPRVAPPFTLALDLLFGGTRNFTSAIASQGGSGGAGGGWSVNIPANSRSFRLTFGGVADYAVAGGVSMSNGVLYRLAVVVTGNGGQARYFLDGRFASSVSVGTMNQPGSRPLTFGASHNGSSFIDPLIAGFGLGNVSLWSRALLDQEIADDARDSWGHLARRIVVPYSAAAPALPTLTALARTNPRRPRYEIG
jgi:hypothetical protein